MNTFKIKTGYVLLLCTIIYTYLFWQQSLGINLLLFSILMISILFFKYKESFKSKVVCALIVGTIISGIMTVLIHSLNAVIVHILSMGVLVGFIHHPKLLSPMYSLISIIESYFILPYQALQKYSNSDIVQSKSFQRIFYFIKLLNFPLIIFFVFVIIYSIANSIFFEFLNSFGIAFVDWLIDKFETINIEFMFFLTTGIFIIAGLLYRQLVPKYFTKETSLSIYIKRIKKNRLFNGSMIALSKEYKRAIIVFGLMNLVILFLNLIDIKYLWLGFELSENFCFKDYVHEGTELLIVSILMAMILVIYYLRNNLNFYPKNKLLIVLANIWILQNLFLSISLGLRNYYYIHYHALAYKRIGVFFFLIVVIVWLITILIKINGKRSVYYLLKVNSWNVYFLLICLSCINWNEVIVQYNLNHWNKKDVDIDFYFNLNPSVSYHLYYNFQSNNDLLYYFHQFVY